MKRARTVLLETPFVALNEDGERTVALYAIEFLADDGVWIRVANTANRETAHRMAQHYVDSADHAVGSCPGCGGKIVGSVTAN